MVATLGNRNSLYVRNISPQVSETVLREIFGECGAIEQVIFRSYPNRVNEFFAQVDFATTQGLLEGSKLSGTPILGVVCEVTVIDPYNAVLQKKLLGSQSTSAEAPEPESNEPHGTQIEHARKFRALAEDKRLRTVHLSGFDKSATEAGVRMLCSKFGEVVDLRLDRYDSGEPFALVEFTARETAYAMKMHGRFPVDGHMMVVREAKTMVDTRSFAEQSVHFQQPIFDRAQMEKVVSVQTRLNPKLLQAKKAACEILNEPIPEELQQEEAALEQSIQEQQAAAAVPPVLVPEKEVREEPTASTRSPSSRQPSPPRKRRSHRRSADMRRRGKRRSGSCAGSHSAKRRRAKEAAEQGDAIDLDDDHCALDVAMVPNTDMTVLESPSESSESLCPVGLEPGKIQEVDCDSEAGGSDAPREEVALDGQSAAQAASAADAASQSAPAAATAPGTGAGDAPLKESPLLSAPSADVGSGARGPAAQPLMVDASVALEKWECVKCGEINKGFRTKCNNCGAPGGLDAVNSDSDAEPAWDAGAGGRVDSSTSSSSSSRSPSPASRSAVAQAPGMPAATPSPAKSVAESAPRSVSASPARSVRSQSEGTVSIGSAAEDVVDLGVEGDDDEVEAEFVANRYSGDQAEARARIFHGGDFAV